MKSRSRNGALEASKPSEKVVIAVVQEHALLTGSLVTRCWRERDSNARSLQKKMPSRSIGRPLWLPIPREEPRVRSLLSPPVRHLSSDTVTMPSPNARAGSRLPFGAEVDGESAPKIGFGWQARSACLSQFT